MTREQEILESVTKILIKRLNPKKIILFGSRAKGNNYKNADFDFAVDKKRVSANEQREIMEEIEEVAGLYKVDVVYLSSVDREFKNIVLKTGKVIYERRE